MDNLAERLRSDAERIDVTISPEMDNRIRASLTGIKPDAPRPPVRILRRFSWRWASSATGVAAALAVIVLINLRAPEPMPAMTEPAYTPCAMPSVALRAQTAVLTSPLEQEFEDLQSDLRKAEESLRRDLDTIF